MTESTTVPKRRTRRSTEPAPRRHKPQEELLTRRYTLLVKDDQFLLDSEIAARQLGFRNLPTFLRNVMPKIISQASMAQ